MELIETELTEFTRRSRSVQVAHTATALDRGLEYGERVLILADGEYRTAVVADIDFTTDDTLYRLVLGIPVAAEVAERSLLGEIDVRSTSGKVSLHDVADLLARTGAAHRIPMQRQVARRLLDR
ncbi:hypothetical protein EFK50_16845 [Nocardioides marmoriginsengisoli]|uniref:Uncharacterized protein n=1 Tax=Nocardioides marmoriginsengisoli TaxID=661483 RepID=A0A3N0CCT5_9ACTN|nr:hypothetical protein [Nocardioides marmoriginsengisoli]RNL61051.1 hypothetical protein EFK50_16845 [Nocardioides marmoriginsengisoli]